MDLQLYLKNNFPKIELKDMLGFPESYEKEIMRLVNAKDITQFYGIFCNSIWDIIAKYLFRHRIKTWLQTQGVLDHVASTWGTVNTHTEFCRAMTFLAVEYSAENILNIQEATK